MIALLVNKKEHIFDTQFIHPFVSNKLDKNSGGWSKYINPTREKYLHESIHTNPIRCGGINLSEYLVSPYIVNIESNDEVAWFYLVHENPGLTQVLQPPLFCILVSDQL